MEWHNVVETIMPHVFQISTPRGHGSGCLVSASITTDVIAIATAAHVVSLSNWWEEPIRIYHPSSEKSLLLRHPDRVIILENQMDTAAILFRRQDFALPSSLIALINEDRRLKIGNEIGWLGFPVVSPSDPCFFTGKISTWRQDARQYLVDGVAIHGVSGGPAFTANNLLIGIVSDYIPNISTGQTLPGLSVVRDIKQIQEVAKSMRSLDDAAKQQKPEPPQPITPHQNYVPPGDRDLHQSWHGN